VSDKHEEALGGARMRQGQRMQTYIVIRKEITWKQNEPEAVISHTVRRRNMGLKANI